MATKLSSGRYRAQIFVGTENGKRIYQSFIADTADEADYQALAYKLGKGKADTGTVTLRAAIDCYINSKDGILAQSTITSYKSVKKYISDDLLNLPITKITTLILQNEINRYAKRKSDGKGKIGGISPKTVRNCYGLITAALRQNGIALMGITLPAKDKIEYNTPFDDDLAEIFRVCEGTNLEIPVYLAAMCSLRRSEILGLQFRDIKGNALHIQRAKVYIGAKADVKKPKTKTSDRIVHLPQFLADKINALPRSKETDYIVNLHGGTISTEFTRLLERNGIKPCRFHDLRHAYVSILAAHGVDEKYIQEMGGWSSRSGIMNTVYKQTSEERKKEIAETAENVFQRILQHDATRKVEKT